MFGSPPFSCHLQLFKHLNLIEFKDRVDQLASLAQFYNCLCLQFKVALNLRQKETRGKSNLVRNQVGNQSKNQVGKGTVFN